jgi:dihydroorotase
MTTEKITQLLAIKPRQIFNLPIPCIKEGEPCRVTIFSLDEEKIFQEKDIRSRSKNNAFIGQLLKGNVLATICNNQISTTHGR